MTGGRRSRLVLLALVALVAVAAAAGGQERAGRVVVTVSVDWEGRRIADADAAAMARLREALPDVPLTHFLNAAYYTKEGADAGAVTAAIARSVADGDETGLHIHGWRSLVAASGVEFRSRPTFWGEGYPLSEFAGDVGHEVELGAYSLDELRRIVRTSRRLLAAGGFETSASFRAGGWLADPVVLEAVRAEGFVIDSSATDPVWHDELEGYPIRDRIGELWSEVTPESSPYRIETPAGPVLEMPDTGALADYLTADEMADHLLAAVGRLDGRDVYVHVGFHQETAARYAGRVGEAVGRLRARAGDSVVFLTLADAAARFEAGRR